MIVAAFHLPPLSSKLVSRSGKVVGFPSKDVGFRSKIVFLNRFLIDYDGIHAKTIKEKKPKKKQPLRCFPFRHNLDCQGDNLLYLI